MAMIPTTRALKVAIHLVASKVVSEEVASTRSRISSRPVEGVVGSHSSLDTSNDGRSFDAVFVGMMLDDNMRMLHDSLSETEDIEKLCTGGANKLSLYHHILINFSTNETSFTNPFSIPIKWMRFALQLLTNGSLDLQKCSFQFVCLLHDPPTRKARH